MEIQYKLLMEQISLLASSGIGEKFLRPSIPCTVEEFRTRVPITTYEDYASWFMEKREDVLPVKPRCWVRTTGRSGPFKWIPVTEGMFRKMCETNACSVVLSTCDDKGNYSLRPGDVIFNTAAPPPYISGCAFPGFVALLGLRCVPPLETLQMDYHQRMELGFKMALKTGLDFFGGLASVMVKIGEQFSQRKGKFSVFYLQPAVFQRLAQAYLKSKIAGRSPLPRDLWRVKGTGCSGTDTVIYRDKVERYWGRKPLEAYGATEPPGVMAVQMWNHKGMTFFPDLVFLEFIPEKDVKKRNDKSYVPTTYLYRELRKGERYEVVITNFYGGPLVRYRMGDLIEVIDLEDEELNIKLPQIIFYSRCDEVIDISGFTRLTERTIWQAIENTGLKYEDWTVRKEIVDGEPVLHLYLELKPHYVSKLGKLDSYYDRLESNLGLKTFSPQEVSRMVHESLKKIDPAYQELESILNLYPLRVTLLSPGTLQRFFEWKKSGGADLAHLKPQHIQPPDEVIEKLLQFSKEIASREAIS